MGFISDRFVNGEKLRKINFGVTQYITGKDLGMYMNWEDVACRLRKWEQKKKIWLFSP